MGKENGKQYNAKLQQKLFIDFGSGVSNEDVKYFLGECFSAAYIKVNAIDVAKLYHTKQLTDDHFKDMRLGKAIVGYSIACGHFDILEKHKDSISKLAASYVGGAHEKKYTQLLGSGSVGLSSIYSPFDEENERKIKDSFEKIGGIDNQEQVIDTIKKEINAIEGVNDNKSIDSIRDINNNFNLVYAANLRNLDDYFNAYDAYKNDYAISVVNVMRNNSEVTKHTLGSKRIEIYNSLSDEEKRQIESKLADGEIEFVNNYLHISDRKKDTYIYDAKLLEGFKLTNSDNVSFKKTKDIINLPFEKKLRFDFGRNVTNEEIKSFLSECYRQAYFTDNSVRVAAKYHFRKLEAKDFEDNENFGYAIVGYAIASGHLDILKKHKEEIKKIFNSYSWSVPKEAKYAPIIQGISSLYDMPISSGYGRMTKNGDNYFYEQLCQEIEEISPKLTKKQIDRKVDEIVSEFNSIEGINESKSLDSLITVNNNFNLFIAANLKCSDDNKLFEPLRKNYENCILPLVEVMRNSSEEVREVIPPHIYDKYRELDRDNSFKKLKESAVKKLNDEEKKFIKDYITERANDSKYYDSKLVMGFQFKTNNIESKNTQIVNKDVIVAKDKNQELQNNDSQKKNIFEFGFRKNKKQVKYKLGSNNFSGGLNTKKVDNPTKLISNIAEESNSKPKQRIDLDEMNKERIKAKGMDSKTNIRTNAMNRQAIQKNNHIMLDAEPKIQKVNGEKKKLQRIDSREQSIKNRIKAYRSKK